MQQTRAWRWRVSWLELGFSLAPDLLLVLLLAAATGCRSTDNFSRIVNEPAPLPESVRSGFGKVGVLPPGTAADFVFAHPASRGQIVLVRSTETFNTLASRVTFDTDDQAQASHRAQAKPDQPRIRAEHSERDLTKGIRPGIPDRKEANDTSGHTHAHHHDDSSSSFGDEIGQEATEVLAGLVIIGAVSLVDGLAEALLTGASKTEIKQSELALRKTLRDNPLQPGIQTCLGQLAGKGQLEHVVAVPDSALPAPTSQTETNNLQATLSSLGLDSLLSIRITQQGFRPGDGLNRSLGFVAEAEVRVTRLSNGEVLHAGFLDYQSRERKFTEWGASHARLLRAELRQAQRQFAEAIVEQLFAPELAPR